MSDHDRFIVTPWDQSSTHCACCGQVSVSLWGGVSAEDRPVAIYYVQWTVDAPQHDANIDLVIGEWGDGAEPADRILISLRYRCGDDGGVMVIDGAGRPADQRSMCGHAAKRDEVIGTPLAANAFGLFDAIWFQDARMAGLREP